MSGSHIVEPGDTLGGIASKYELSLDDLIRWNNIENPDHIDVGQKIELSGHEPAPDGDQIYVVQPGDTVSEIAEKFGLRWVDIGAANKLEDINKIYAGQELVIPATGVARGPGT
ncbi:MAG: LysM peptidoglycan-binding domain-containing protein [Geodermatophilaceae bacterium]|nr:LysM peptidoglycan-binding domain-containing protein [Geodermatophilaceae bacterium]